MKKDFLKKLGLKQKNNGTSTGQKSYASKEYIESYSPVDGAFIGSVGVTSKADYERVVKAAQKAFIPWRSMPAPKRGEIVRQYGEALRKHKEPLGKLVSYEMGKSLQEGLGEVQEMIDICDFAVGLSRQLYGLTMHSERPNHRMYEQWHPLGVVGIISAFNFPVAVWSWNSMIALVCGDVSIWKPSEKTPLCSVACQNIFQKVLKDNKVPEGVSCIVNGDYKVGEYMTKDTRVPLISATGSTRMGKIVNAEVAGRLGRTILELGGNNAIITRRLIVHDSIYDKVKKSLVKAYKQLRIGSPLNSKNHVGPLIDKDAVEMYLDALKKVKEEGGKLAVAGGVLKGAAYKSGCYVKPAIAEVENHFKIVQHETFAPILYLMKYKNFSEAITMQNDVPQGLSSAVMTDSLKEAEAFLSVAGSDCGIAKSGSDSWKAYMRRQTNTINYSKELPLAQGIKFDF